MSPGQELAYAIVEGLGVFRAERGAQSLSVLEDPRTGAAFPGAAVDMEVGSGAQDVFFAFGPPGKIVRMNASGQRSARRAGDWFVTDRNRGSLDSREPPPRHLEVYGGSEQLSAVGVPFGKPLTVRALSGDGRGVFKAPVTFSSATPGVGFDPIHGGNKPFRGGSHDSYTSYCGPVSSGGSHFSPALPRRSLTSTSWDRIWVG